MSTLTGPRPNDYAHQTDPLSSAFDWVLVQAPIADDVADIAVTIDGVPMNRPRAIVCTGDGDITLRARSGNTITLTLTADPRPLPYSPVGVNLTGLTATVYLLY